MSNSTVNWCNQCGGTLTSPLHLNNCPAIKGEMINLRDVLRHDDSVLGIRLDGAREAAADLAERLNKLHDEACLTEPYLAMLLLPLIGDARHTRNLLEQLMGVRK